MYLVCRLPPRTPLCPYTTLFRSPKSSRIRCIGGSSISFVLHVSSDFWQRSRGRTRRAEELSDQLRAPSMRRIERRQSRQLQTILRKLDRKSTRLNSSHRCISYAVSLRERHSVPTRRSSDLRRAPGSGASAVRVSALSCMSAATSGNVHGEERGALKS